MADDAVFDAQIKEILADPKVKEAMANVESVMKVQKTLPGHQGAAVYDRANDALFEGIELEQNSIAEALRKRGLASLDSDLQSLPALGQAAVKQENKVVAEHPNVTDADRATFRALELAGDFRVQRELNDLETLKKVKAANNASDPEGVVSAYLDVENAKLLAQVANELGASPKEQAKAQEFLNAQMGEDLRIQPKQPTWRDDEKFRQILSRVPKANEPQEFHHDSVLPPITPPVPSIPHTKVRGQL